MSSVRQAVERVRNDGRMPTTGIISLIDLHNKFPPNPRKSVRALLSSMFDGASRLPWAVILCRFKGEQADPARENAIETFYREVFTPGTGGLIEFWRDVSLGKIDASASRVFGWTEVDIARNMANIGNGTNRSTLVDAAIRAIRRDGQDPETGFHSQIAIYTENWSSDSVPPGLDWRDPKWGSYWIDGSADGRGKVTLTPPHNGNICAHEMGHGYGMSHDLAADLMTHYGDPCCIMSQKNSFAKPPWMRQFGPALCLPHLVQKDWMYQRRLYIADNAWMSDAAGISLPLASLGDPGAPANLGIKLAFQRGGAAWDYFIEYVKPVEWDKGLGKSYVFIRRLAALGGGQTPAILGSIEVPQTADAVARFVEPSGNVEFTVERFQRDGRVMRVGAKRL